MQADITGKFGGLGIEVTMENGVIKAQLIPNIIGEPGCRGRIGIPARAWHLPAYR
jgi:hypothetical protein